ncbi:cobalt ECF transporter T component CbiQ [Dissulfurispira thermophila]|uniref:Cobalt ECF transporter T component CbiQ n=2 Tax=root TaxID=1 RepID=A0A7G1H1W3_9BACT|nr:energy-coupling factor transporter transmembrane component T [Dissulfurispira thermophila]BCB95936.1 cobalt ECF transporter T component CbiQ [Dissulfurispira thermophila]
MSFIDSSISHLGKVIKSGYIQWELSSKDGFFHGLDARVKMLFLIFFIIIISLKKEILSELIIVLFIFGLTAISRLNLFNFYKKVIPLGFIFGFLIALPSSFNVITKGEIILPVIHFSKSYDFWIYHIPETIGITRQGISGVFMLTLRVFNSIALSFLILYTTPFSEIIRALKVFKVPDAVLMIITLTYKYIFIFAKTVEDVYLAKKSRTAVKIDNNDARNWTAGRIVFMLKKTQQRCDDVFKAMLSRGFSDTIKLYGFRKMDSRDWTAGLFLFFAGVMFLWI